MRRRRVKSARPGRKNQAGCQASPRRAEGEALGSLRRGLQTPPASRWIKQKYRERYEDGSCGDGLARKLRKYLETETGRSTSQASTTSRAKRPLASRYASLNPAWARGRGHRLRKLFARRQQHRLGLILRLPGASRGLLHVRWSFSCHRFRHEI